MLDVLVIMLQSTGLFLQPDQMYIIHFHKYFNMKTLWQRWNVGAQNASDSKHGKKLHYVKHDSDDTWQQNFAQKTKFSMILLQWCKVDDKFELSCNIVWYCITTLWKIHENKCTLCVVLAFRLRFPISSFYPFIAFLNRFIGLPARRWLSSAEKDTTPYT